MQPANPTTQPYKLGIKKGNWTYALAREGNMSLNPIVLCMQPTVPRGIAKKCNTRHLPLVVRQAGRNSWPHERLKSVGVCHATIRLQPYLAKKFPVSRLRA